jgi:hypothetical protein
MIYETIAKLLEIPLNPPFKKGGDQSFIYQWYVLPLIESV